MFCAIKKYSLSHWPFVMRYLPLRWDRRGSDGNVHTQRLDPRRQHDDLLPTSPPPV